jgi:hypothetical protein
MSEAPHSLVQVPAEQNKPGAQAFPQLPQFWGSYEVSVHVWPHAASPLRHEQPPAWHT